MKRSDHLKLHLVAFVILSAQTSLCASPADPPGTVCPLNFTAYPQLPVGECDGVDGRINDWDGVVTTRCCRTGLDTLSEALALQASSKATNPIFIEKEQWQSCDKTFSKQESVSINSCGFQNLYYGSSPYSNYTWSSFKGLYPKHYEDLLLNCYNFSAAFDDTCKNCTNMIKTVRDFILNDVDNGAKGKGVLKWKGVCSVLVVTVTAIEYIANASWINNYYRCLSALDTKESGYITIKYSLVKALLAILVAMMAVMLIVVLIKYVTRKIPPKHVEGKEISAWSGLYRFSRPEIENAMNFSNHKVSLGAGSAGRVYKGVLPSGQVVAIKHIYKSNTSDSFTREVEGLSRVRHPNLVCLFGCCIDGGEQYLVYEYCSNGNLSQHLQRRDVILPWEQRVQILRDCALALRFLHTCPDGCIVHRDIKLTNILLTDKMEPKLSDFGLAKMLGMEESKVFTDVRGTIGYMDPEYMSNAKLTCASDVYSFGIVILQLLSGRKVIELDLDARDQLTRKAKDVIMGRRPLTDFEDPRLNGKLNIEDFESILHVAVLCVARSSKGRPTIDVVFSEIDRAWKNTVVANLKANREAPSTPQSRSLEVMSV